MDLPSNFQNGRRASFAISSTIEARRFREACCSSTFGDIDGDRLRVRWTYTFCGYGTKSKTIREIRDSSLPCPDSGIGSMDKGFANGWERNTKSTRQSTKSTKRSHKARISCVSCALTCAFCVPFCSVVQSPSSGRLWEEGSIPPHLGWLTR